MRGNRKLGIVEILLLYIMIQKKIYSYKDLIVWQKSMTLVDEIYKVTKKFPQEELFSLTNQIRRSAVSIPSNIAEGHQRGTRKDYAHFITIAFGSSAELETQLLIARRQNYNTMNDFEKCDNFLEEVVKMLNTLQSKLRNSHESSSPPTT